MSPLGRRREGPAGLPYVALADAAEVPNVMADGAAIASTVLTLSHWPGSATPEDLAHDLSAGIAFRHLRSRRRRPAAEAVTADHFDQDGLVTVAALVDPAWALENEALLMDVAEAGDFTRTGSRRAARMAFALDRLAATWDAGGDRNPALTGGLHRAGLDRLRSLVDDLDAHRAEWEEEDAHLEAGEEAFRSGTARLTEHPGIDLVVVEAAGPVHRMCVHNRSDRMRVLVLTPPGYELYLRYETWVRLASHRPPLRPDLGELAGALTAAEPSGAAWRFNGAAAIAPRLAPEGGRSDLAPERVRSLVEEGLARARPGWDPYRPRVGR